MKILSIHLSERQLETVTNLLVTGDVVTHLYHAQNITEACAQIKEDDYAVVLYQLDASFDRADLDRLVGLTLISTRVIVLGEAMQMVPCQGWQELGVQFLVSPNSRTLIKALQAAIKK
jgi:hypothetical protein